MQREITLNSIYGAQRTAMAVVYGPFGIHRGDDGFFVVTHIGTGRAVVFSAPSLGAGLKLARMLTRCGARWSFADAKKMSKRTARLAKDAVARWKALTK